MEAVATNERWLGGPLGSWSDWILKWKGFIILYPESNLQEMVANKEIKRGNGWIHGGLPYSLLKN